MRISPTGQREYHDGRQIGEYARSPELGPVFVWYHNRGLQRHEHRAWTLNARVAERVSVSCDHFVVVQQPDGAWLVERSDFEDTANLITIDGQEQYVASAVDPFVNYIEQPGSTLRGGLYVESGNQVDEGYHKRRNES